MDDETDITTFFDIGDITDQPSVWVRDYDAEAGSYRWRKVKEPKDRGEEIMDAVRKMVG